MALRFRADGFPESPRFIGGADIAFCPPDSKCQRPRAGAVGCMGIGVAVVWDMVERRFTHYACAHRRVTLPYIPGLLSFREAPVLLAAMRAVKVPVDAWMFDGQGISHPRCCGLATHMGIVADVASVGVAKSLLCGACQPGASVARRWPTRPVIHQGRVIAVQLRRTPESTPVYISQGHRCKLDQAVALTRKCLIGDFLPQPTDVADKLSKQLRGLPPAAARARLRKLTAEAENDATRRVTIPRRQPASREP